MMLYSIILQSQVPVSPNGGMQLLKLIDYEKGGLYYEKEHWLDY